MCSTLVYSWLRLFILHSYCWGAVLSINACSQREGEHRNKHPSITAKGTPSEGAFLINTEFADTDSMTFISAGSPLSPNHSAHMALFQQYFQDLTTPLETEVESEKLRSLVSPFLKCFCLPPGGSR